jgi:hypothetical protein
MPQERITAEQAYANIAGVRYLGGDYLYPLASNTPFECPHCGVFADHQWGVVKELVPYPGYNSFLDSRPFATSATGVLSAAKC